MNAKISDFGMARLFAKDETRGNTRRIAGTYGYMASEIVSGKNNSHDNDNGDNVEHLLSNVWRSWREEEGNCNIIIDPVLRDHANNRMKGVGDEDMMMMTMKRCIHTGLLCCQENAEIRPTMASVVQMLNNFNLTSLPAPSKTGFYFYGNGGDDIHGANQNCQQYSNHEEDSIPLKSQQHQWKSNFKLVKTNI